MADDYDAMAAAEFAGYTQQLDQESIAALAAVLQEALPHLPPELRSKAERVLSEEAGIKPDARPFVGPNPFDEVR